MKKIVILGAGAGGTMVAAKLRKALREDQWSITMVDADEMHHYQPGYLFIPFGMYTREMVLRPKRDFIPPGVELVIDEVTEIDPKKKQVGTKKGRKLPYDFLVVGLGCRIAPDEVEGMMEGWGKNVHTFYNLDGAVALSKAMKFFDKGKLVLNIAEIPFKCPVAPLEFVFLADWFFQERGIRDKVEIELVTPLPHAFTKPKAAAILGDFCERKNITVTPNFNVGEVHAEKGYIEEMGAEGRKVDFDLLVAIPPNLGPKVIEDCDLDGGNAGYMPTDKGTLKARELENVYVIGDNADLPTSKAGSVAHFASEILCENLLREIEGLEPKAIFDGHSNCFIESGFEKGILIDFNYDVEPLPGRFPLPGVGPFALLQETRMNHWGKLMFKWIYWNILLKGEELPLEPQMSMYGKWAD
jgi:sulfide:quinone oxidoreductase